MKKYINIFKMSFKENLRYIPALLARFISFFVTMFILIYLWKYIYSDPDKIMNGYSYVQIIWYVLMAEIIMYGTNSKEVSNNISLDIKNGNIAYLINKPYSYIGYVLSKYIAESIIKMTLYTIVCIVIGFIFVQGLENFNISNLIFIIIIYIMAMIINGLIKICISLSSFWIEESQPLHNIYHKILLVLGTFFPIEMLPKILQPILKYLPNYTVTYGPAKIVVDFSLNNFFTIFTAQVIYLIISIVLVILIYRKGVRKVNVNGG